jgi:hypothetical protein
LSDSDGWGARALPSGVAVRAQHVRFPPAGWYPDPAGHYELRWWDGGGWTESASSGGATAIDPLEGQRALGGSAGSVDRAVSFKEHLDGQYGVAAITDIGSSATAVVGSAARTFLRVYQSVPFLSAPSDLIRAKNGLELLVDEIRRCPDDPERYLWLSEAVVRAQRDGLGLAIVRTIFEPLALVEAIAIRKVAQLGLEDPPAVALRKSAFSLAVQRLRRDPRDAVALHVTSRIYLLQGDLLQALRFAWLATATAPGDPLPLVTMAMAQAKTGDVNGAAAAAWMGIDGGSSFGFVVLAQLAAMGFADSRTSAFATTTVARSLTGLERARVALLLQQQIRPEDRDRYFGPRLHGVQILTAVLLSQKHKIEDLLEDQ